MPEPTIPAAGLAAAVATVSAAVLAVLGIDYYALVGAFVGALLGVSAMRTTGLLPMLLTLAITTLAAAAIGQGFAEVIGSTKRPVLMLCCLVLGAVGQGGLQGIAAKAAGAVSDRLNAIVGGPRA